MIVSRESQSNLDFALKTQNRVLDSCRTNMLYSPFLCVRMHVRHFGNMTPVDKTKDGRSLEEHAGEKNAAQFFFLG